MSKNLLINSSLEAGLRVLIILDSIFPDSIDIDRLVIYDYLIIHTKDVKVGKESLHPPTPHRLGELFVRRELLQEGISLMESRELLQIEYTSNGIMFKASLLTGPFIKYFESQYSHSLRQNALFIQKIFKDLSYSDLKKYVIKNLDSWGGEFTKQSILREDGV
ncbi:hypothetical protein RKD56_004223 [Priestia megaterium]|jgi:hypothetical protein